MKKYGEFYITIGLEIHIALQTKYKLFSGSDNNFEINDFSLFDAGIPGILPVISREPVEMASAFALSVDASLEKYSEFERKHYFYPDLPLGYQITQQHKPILIGGQVPISINGINKLIQIEHAHLECDAAKSIHDMYSEYTAIDISRCASPLLEIVSTPCMHSPEEAKEYAKAVHGLVMFLGICDGKMEEGSFRVDASISINREIGKLGTRVEVKNISSFGFLQSALEYEIERQSEIVLNNGSIVMETRLYDEVTNSTKSMRKKETVDEYRYMPDPDILPLILDDELIDNVKSKYIFSYFQMKSSIINEFKRFNIELDEGLLQQLIFSQKNIWVEVLKDKEKITEKLLRLLAFWIPEIISKNESTKKISLTEIFTLEKSALQAKEIKETLTIWLQSNKDLKDCMPSFIDVIEVEKLVKSILEKYPEQIIKYKSGELKILQFLIGKVMSETKGKAPAALIKEIVEKLI
jgi:aspartyl-tRNA(Asn)/glutamyl-tRNA(Gln) amidotransferase subunit B